MIEKREQHRRLLTPTVEFPFCTMRGEFIESERRRLPTRRVNDIEVEEITIEEFISGLH